MNPSVEAHFDGLANLKTDIIPWKDPQAWLSFSTDHVARHAATFSAFKGDVFFRTTPIHQRLFVHAFARLLSCSTTGDQVLKDLKTNLRTWMTWDDVTVLANYRAIGEKLREALYQVENAVHQGLPDELNRLLNLDFIATCAHLLVIFRERSKYEAFLARRGEDAQCLLNLLQELLDYPNLHNNLKGPFTNALLKLSEKPGLYPECLMLRGVQRLGNPVAAGTFGDVWKGVARDVCVAIKVLRVYERTDVDKHLKVILLIYFLTAT